MTAVHRNRLLYNFSSLTVLQAGNFLLSFIVIPHVVRKIGAEGFGVVSVAQVLMVYLGILVEYGFSQTATRDIAIHRNSSDTRKISSIFVSVMISKLLVCIACFVILLGLLFTIPLFYDHFYLYLLAFSFVIGQTFMMNWFFNGMEKMQYVALSSLFGRLIFVLLVFAFIRTKNDAPLFLFFMGMGNIVGALLSIFLAFRIYKLRFVKLSWSDVVHELRKGWPVTVTNLNITTCQYAGIFILRIFTNDLIVGYYSIAEKVFFAMKLMVNVFTQVAFPIVCQLMQAGKRHAMNFMRTVYLPYLVLVFLCTLAVYIFSPQILFFLIGHEHPYTSFLLRLFCFTVIIVCLNIPPYLMLLADDHRRSYLKIFSIGTAIYLCSNILLAYYFQATGTVIATIATEIIITTGLYWEAYRIFYVRKDKITAPDLK